MRRSKLKRQSPRMAPRFGASMMMLVGQIGPKLFLPVGIILSKNDVIITDFFQSRARGHDEISRLHVSAGEASWCSIAISAIFFAVRALFQVTSRPGITIIFFWDALSQVVSSDFSAAIMNIIGGSQDWKGSVDFVSLRSPLSASRPAKPSLCQRPLPFPIDIGLCFCCSQCYHAPRNLRRRDRWRNFNGLSFFAVRSSLASRHRCSTHRKTSVRLRRALPTGSHSCAQPSTFSERCDAAPP